MEPKEQDQHNHDRHVERVSEALENNWHDGDSTHIGQDAYGKDCIWDQHRADIYRERAAGK